MSTTRLDEIGIFLLSNLFTSRLNAIGISNLPTAVATLRAAWKDDAKKQKGWLVYGVGIFNALVVVSGITGKCPSVIKMNAIANIAMGVKDSITARKKAETMSEDELNQQVSKKRSILSTAIVDRFFSNSKGSATDPKEEGKNSNSSATATIDPSSKSSTAPKEEKNVDCSSSASNSLKRRFFASRKESTTSTQSACSAQEGNHLEGSRRKKTLEKAKALLAGKRESAVDDVLWGVFQISLIFFDASQYKAVGHAWMVFLLHALEETVLNEALDRKRKMRKFAYLTVTAYVSGRLVFKL